MHEAVAGNRRFGIYSDPDHSGEYVFYTMGVDRAWDGTFNLGNIIFKLATKQSGFDKADELWSSLQSKMIQFIEHNGGSATHYSKQKIIARPKWVQVERYLKCEINFTTLKSMLGC